MRALYKVGPAYIIVKSGVLSSLIESNTAILYCTIHSLFSHPFTVAFNGFNH